MKTRAWWALAAVAGLGMAMAPAGRGDDAPATQGTMVKFPGGAGEIGGYLARPKGEGPFPAVVVIHEWWGLTDWVKQNADRLAAQGYVALAPDLYGGKSTADPMVAHELMRALDPGDGLADLKGAVAYLGAQPFVKKDTRYGAIGWCMGGMYARTLAQDSDAVGPTAICYGSISVEPGQVAKLKGKPVLGIFGATDRGIPADKVRDFGKALDAASDATVDIQIYPGAGHAFMRKGGDQYAAEAADDAWNRIDAFFAANLKK